MALEVTGKVVEISDARQVGDNKVMDIVIQQPGEYGKQFQLAVWNDKIDKCLNVFIDDEVSIKFNISSSRNTSGYWNTKASLYDIKTVNQ